MTGITPRKSKSMKVKRLIISKRARAYSITKMVQNILAIGNRINLGAMANL